MQTLKESNAWIPEIHLLAILKGVTAAAYHLQITLGRVLCEVQPGHVLYDGYVLLYCCLRCIYTSDL